MSDSSIRHLVASITRGRIAAGEFERQVHIWDLIDRSPVSTFNTTLDFDGERLALAGDGRHCVAGAYRVHGVACYSADDGSKVWRRKDLSRTQCVRFSPDDSRVIVSCDDRACYVLGRETGETLAVSRGVKDVIESPWQSIVLVSKRDFELRTLEQKRIGTIPRVTFTELGVAFGPRHVCISESAGPVRCHDTESGQELWRHWEKGRHVLRLCYGRSYDCFLSIDWPYEEGGIHRLLHFDVRTGHCSVVTELERPGEVVFCLEGGCLVTADGRVLDTRTGAVVAQLWLPTQ